MGFTFITKFLENENSKIFLLHCFDPSMTESGVMRGYIEILRTNFFLNSRKYCNGQKLELFALLVGY